MKSSFSPTASPSPAKSPMTDAMIPIDERLDDHRPEDLAARGADGSHRRELARALRDRDRERVEDDERADEERDAGEGEQEVLDEVRELADLVLVLGCLGGRRAHLCVVRQDRLDVR